MFFRKVHEVGNRLRWRTTQTISLASMALVASEIESFVGVTGLIANARTGSITITVNSTATISRVEAYFEWLKTHPPIQRHQTPAAMRAFNQAKAQIAQARETPTAVQALLKASDRLMSGMPIIQAVGRIPRFFANKVSSLGKDETVLDLSPLARYVFVRPFLPIVVNTINAILGSLPIIAQGLKSLLQGKLNVSVLDAAALSVSLLRRDFKTAGLLLKDEVLPLAAYGQFLKGEFDGIHIITKGGSQGESDAINRCITYLKEKLYI